MEYAVPNAVALHFFSFRGIAGIRGQLVERVIPLTFDHRFPTDSLHFIDSLNSIYLIHYPFQPYHIAFLFCNVIVYLVEASIMMG